MFLENESGLQTYVERMDQIYLEDKNKELVLRALIRKTPILLLDEATSSLDNQVTTEIESSILDIQI